MKRSLLSLALPIIAALSLSSCETMESAANIATVIGQSTGVITGTQGESIRKSTKAVARSMEDFTPEQEYYIGRTVGAVVLSKYRAYDLDPVNRYLNVLGQTLAQASDLPSTFGGYHFLVLDSDDINAFATPSGLVFVTRGLLRCSKSEDALAAVLAHEVGHVQLRHGMQAIEKARVLDSAHRLESSVDTREGVLEMARAYEAASAADPTSRKALIGIANARILLATGYTTARWEKAEHYQKAMQAAEKALLLNQDFRRQVEAGTPVWEAVSWLGKDDADGMGYWSFGACYYYREGISGLAKAWNFQWIDRARIFMRRIEEVHPSWNDGGNLFNIAIVYIALPQSRGGDLKKADEYFEKAIQAGLDSILVRWGRAKYLATRNKDRESFRADLEWVVAQDPREGRKRPYCWNVYFQREAKSLLDSIDQLF